MIRCQRQVIGVGTIAHVDEIPRLLAIAVDDHRLAQQHFSRKDCDHARLALRVLTRPKHIRITQYCVWQAIVHIIHIKVVLYHMLARAVGANGVDRMLLITGKPFWLAVSSSPTGNIDEMLDSKLSGTLN